ncbi:hypothetical protein [Paenibacillus lautus]|uniref:hypothetical protein n=1 Tax=Paenibacillus lautus TaxID=1401 RepID=UPI003D278455
MSIKIKVQPIPKNFEEELERITDSGQSVLASPVDSKKERLEIRKSMIEIMRKEKAQQR